MGKRENIVETYFDKQVEEVLNGITRKWVCPGQDGAPDRIPIWAYCPGQVFVEVKTVDGSLSPVQEREHTRLREVGALVFTVYGQSGVDAFIKLADGCSLTASHAFGVFECR